MYHADYSDTFCEYTLFFVRLIRPNSNVVRQPVNAASSDTLTVCEDIYNSILLYACRVQILKFLETTLFM